jgi:hypothetical protein
MNQKRVFLVPMMQMAAGLGWIGGTYAQSAWPLWSQVLLQLIHYIPVALLFLFGMRFLTDQSENNNWGRSGLIVLTVLVKVTMVAWIIVNLTHFMGLTGPHGFNDWFPIGVTNAGSGLLLGLLITRRDQRFKQVRV